MVDCTSMRSTEAGKDILTRINSGVRDFVGVLKRVMDTAMAPIPENTIIDANGSRRPFPSDNDPMSAAGPYTGDQAFRALRNLLK